MIQPAQTYPARARFKFRNGRVGDVRYAADIPAGIAGGRGEIAASLLGADIAALLREGALGSLGGQSDYTRNAAALKKMCVDVPLEVRGMGHYGLRAALFGGKCEKSVRGLTYSVSYFQLDISMGRPNVSNGGQRSPCAGDGSYIFEHPRTFVA